MYLAPLMGDITVSPLANSEVIGTYHKGRGKGQGEPIKVRKVNVIFFKGVKIVTSFNCPIVPIYLPY